jgi:dephospho-CoA kinase
MLKVGLTGNVAAGKSVVVGQLRRLGAIIIDADELVREVEQPGSALLEKIANRFGSEMVLPNGQLDRARLRRRVMGDRAALSDLNAIIHPAVERLHRERLAEAAATGARIVVSDIPLLFEAGWEDAFDLIILVDAPPKIRRRRLVAFRRLTPPEADRLIASQDPADRKRRRSDIVIDNTGTLEALEARVQEVWDLLVARADAGA